MILDTVDHLEQYRDAYPKVYCALQAMQAYTAENYPQGRVDIDGDSLFLLLNEYETANPAEAVMEAHRQYLDVMYMVDGSERIYVKSTAWLKSITRPYDSVDDALLADLDSDSSVVLLQTGSFVILFPQDAHCPACWGIDGVARVKKIIGKVKID